jgi:hypothetical protein
MSLLILVGLLIALDVAAWFVGHEPATAGTGTDGGEEDVPFLSLTELQSSRSLVASSDEVEATDHRAAQHRWDRVDPRRLTCVSHIVLWGRHWTMAGRVSPRRCVGRMQGQPRSG